MAECRTCKKALKGSWYMTTSGGHEKTGRYLGITDGYFLYNERPNRVYCYCFTCWQNQILSLSFIPRTEQNQMLQQQNTSLQQQLTAAQTEVTSCRKQLDELNEIYQKLANPSGIEKIRDLIKQLSPPQMETLHTHTNFRVDTFETVHAQQQIQFSTQFVRSSFMQLQSSVDAVIQLQKNALAKTKQAKESVFQTLATTGMSKTTLDACTTPLETEIKQIEASLEGWNTFSAILTNTINQSIETAIDVSCDIITERIS